MRGRDEVYAGEVKQQDADWVQGMRVNVDATDKEIQEKLKQLYNSSILQGTGDSIRGQLTLLNAVQDHQMTIADYRQYQKAALKSTQRQRCNGYST